MSSRKRDLVFSILQFLEEENFKGAMHKLEQESGFYFNMKYFKEEVLTGNLNDVEKYLGGFINIEDKNKSSSKIFYTIRKEKYLEALDKHDMAKAVEILNKDLRELASSAEDLFKDTELLILENFRENKAGDEDCKSGRENMLSELEILIESHPLLCNKLQFPTLKSSTLVDLVNQSKKSDHHDWQNTSLISENNTRGQPSGAPVPPPANKNGDETTEISEPTHCLSLRLIDNLGSGKISMLVYTNSGVALLALASNANHLLWKWPGNGRHNLSGKATTSVPPQLWRPPKGIVMANDVTGRNHEDAVHCFALNKDGEHIVSASGGNVTLFNARTFETLRTVMTPPPAATYIAFHPQKKNLLAIGMNDCTIRIYDTTNDKELKVLDDGHSKKITGLSFSSVLSLLASSDANAQIQLWKDDSWNKLRKRIELPMPYSGNPKFGNSDTRVEFDRLEVHCLAVHETFICIFGVQKREIVVQWLLPHENAAPITYATYSCDCQVVYATFKDATVCIFDAEKLKIRCRILPSAYLHCNLSANVHQSVIAVHPSKPNKFAIGLTDGAVYVLEPGECEATWVIAPPDQA